MIPSHSPSTITSNMAYYDPRSSNYYQQVNSTNNQQIYMSPSHSAAAAAAAAAAGLSSSSLPPLSRLLPPPSATIESGNSPMQPVSHVVTSKVEAQQTMQPHSDYYHSPVSERGHQQQQQRQVPSSGYPYPPSEMPYRKSIDSSRPVYPPTVPSSEIPRRNYVASQEVPNNYYLVQQQPAEGGPPAGYPTHPPTVPSSNLPMFQAPPSSLNNYHRAQPPQYHLTSHHSMMDPMMMDPHGMHSSNSQKVFSFVPLPGLNQKKRPRRKYHEVERLYQCNYQDCSKAYGTLNHLNAHVSMQKHGTKRQPSEFKELRKMWRKQKRENKRNAAAQQEGEMIEKNMSYSNYNYPIPPPNPSTWGHSNYMPNY